MDVVTANKYCVVPIYSGDRSHNFGVARTIKEVVKKREVDLYALREYFTFQGIVTERTLFKGVSVKPSGNFDFTFKPHTRKYKDCIEELRVLLRAAVSEYSIGVGGLLSGGLDSSTIAAFASELSKEYPTFTVGFADYDKFDESKLAKSVAKHLHLNNHCELLGPSALPDLLDKVIEALEEPKISISYPDYIAYQLAADHGINTLLTGTGGDELFGGYPWKYKASGSEYLAAAQRLVPERDHTEFFSEYVIKETQGYSPLEEFHKRYKYDTIYDRFGVDLKLGLFGQLIANDKFAQRFSLTAQTPFLDNELVEFALKLPAEYKYHKGVSKRILRDAMKGLLPRKIIKRPKQGFYPPDEHWYRNENRAFVESKLNALTKTDFFKPQYLHKIFAEHLAGANHTRLLWSLMSFESWLRVNKIEE